MRDKLNCPNCGATITSIECPYCGSIFYDRLSELRCQYNCFDENERDAYHTLSEAIKVLSDVPDTNVGDMISRQAAIDEADELIEVVYCGRFERRERDAIKYVIDRINRIKALPSAQPEIIRCEHCYHALEEGPKLWCTKGPISIRVNPTHFCGFAERRKK